MRPGTMAIAALALGLLQGCGGAPAATAPARTPAVASAAHAHDDEDDELEEAEIAVTHDPRRPSVPAQPNRVTAQSIGKVGTVPDKSFPILGATIGVLLQASSAAAIL